MVAAPLQSPQRNSIAGFTLLEVLVALTVMGLLLFGLVQGSHFVLLGWDRQTRLAARTEDLDAVDRTLRRLVVQAKPGSKWEPLAFAGTAHSATFTSIVPLPAAGFPTQRADVELVVDAAHRLLLRWTPHFHAINIGRPPPAVTTEVLEGSIGSSYHTGQQPRAGAGPRSGETRHRRLWFASGSFSPILATADGPISWSRRCWRRRDR